MLEHLKLHGVGPASDMEIDFSRRVNLFTGDNGLGKSFILDIAWWALTRTWSDPSLPARPTPEQDKPFIAFRFEGVAKRNEYASAFDPQTQSWGARAGRPSNPGLVLYAQVDGGFALWDPARNYWKKKGRTEVPDRPSAYLFRPRQIWNGLEEGEKILCNGLIRDWDSWQKEGGPAFSQLKAVLSQLSPSDQELLEPGTSVRISLDDVRDIPTIRMPYGQEVPVVHVSAGMKRVIALAYLLVWAWQEHSKASKLLRQATTPQIVFLIDEIEAHLHPRWQRVIVRSLLAVMEALWGTGQTKVQLICATHSPLLLASLEPHFDPDQDTLWKLDLVDDRVKLERFVWTRQGDVNAWLNSVFGIEEPRSLEAEQALTRALKLLRNSEEASADEIESVDRELRAVLGEIDPFFMRWSQFVETKRGAP